LSPQLYTLSLHDALPISPFLFFFFTAVVSPRWTVLLTDELGIQIRSPPLGFHRWNRVSRGDTSVRYPRPQPPGQEFSVNDFQELDRKSTRLNSSHVKISY